MRVFLISLFGVCGAFAAHTLLLSDVFLSPVRFVMRVVMPVAIALVSAALLRTRRSSQWLGVVCCAAAVSTIYAVELYREIDSERKGGSNWSPWIRSEESEYPPLCGKYVMVVDEHGTVRSALHSSGREIQPVSGMTGRVYRDGRASDEFGFYNPPGQWRAEAVALMAVGDSFAAGADVEPGEGFVDRLRDRAGVAINLGCSWNGPLLELASLVEYGPLVRPQTVLWFFFEGNDLSDLEIEARSPLLIRYLEAGFSQRLAERRETVDALLAEYVDRRVSDANGRSRGAERPLGHVVFGDPGADSGPDWCEVLRLQNTKWSMGILDYGRNRRTFGLLAKVVSRARDLVRSWGGDLVFVYLPAEPRFSTFIARIEAEAYRAEVLDVIAGLSLPIIDVTPVFETDPQPRSLFRGHYTPRGNELVAAAVWREIAARVDTPSRGRRPM
jgi:hypothetical protein